MGKLVALKESKKESRFCPRGDAKLSTLYFTICNRFLFVLLTLHVRVSGHDGGLHRRAVRAGRPRSILCEEKVTPWHFD